MDEVTDLQQREITYTLKPGDAEATFSLARPASFRRLAMGLGAAAAVILIAQGAINGWDYALAGLVWAVLMVLYLRLTGGFERNPNFEGPHTFRIEPDGLTTSRDGPRIQPWSLIESVIQARRHIIVQYRSGCSIIVPNRAFASPGERETFYQAAKRWHEAATGAASRL